jgi:hypothetical protein
VSYVQQYNLQWLDDTGVIVGELGFANIPGGLGVWTEVTQTNLAAPANAVSALIQFFGATGAVGASGYGEVLIDDVSLTLAPAPTTNQVTCSILLGKPVQLDFNQRRGGTRFNPRPARAVRGQIWVIPLRVPMARLRFLSQANMGFTGSWK